MKLQQRKAVAPIIATLLMVAVAVIGGMMVFVFAQGFFEETQLVAPNIEQLEIWGYNATDNTTDELQTHAGVIVAVENANNNKLIDKEVFFLFVRNAGGGEVLISDVQVYGTSIPFKSATSFSVTSPTENEWMLSTDGSAPCGCQLLNAGQEGTIAIGYDEDLNGKVKVGRPILVKVETGSGATFTKQVMLGRDSG